MGAVLIVLMIAETFALGMSIARSRDLQEENELLRDTLPYYHTQDWGPVVSVDTKGAEGGE